MHIISLDPRNPSQLAALPHVRGRAVMEFSILVHANYDHQLLKFEDRLFPHEIVAATLKYTSFA